MIFRNSRQHLNFFLGQPRGGHDLLQCKSVCALLFPTSPYSFFTADDELSLIASSRSLWKGLRVSLGATGYTGTFKGGIGGAGGSAGGAGGAAGGARRLNGGASSMLLSKGSLLGGYEKPVGADGRAGGGANGFGSVDGGEG